MKSSDSRHLLASSPQSSSLCVIWTFVFRGIHCHWQLSARHRSVLVVSSQLSTAFLDRQDQSSLKMAPFSNCCTLGSFESTRCSTLCSDSNLCRWSHAGLADESSCYQAPTHSTCQWSQAVQSFYLWCYPGPGRGRWSSTPTFYSLSWSVTALCCLHVAFQLSIRDASNLRSTCCCKWALFHAFY